MTRQTLSGALLRDLRLERQAQLVQWGDQQHLDGTGPAYTDAADKARAVAQEAATDSDASWDLILLEEVYEALAEQPNTPALRAELIQAAAVIIAWIEDIDRRTP